MSKKKKQHFVPQFYLKNFALDASRKNLGIFNIDRQKFILSGTLKDQAYKHYLYGHDLAIENAFSVQEGRTAKVIRAVINQNSISFLTEIEYYYLLEFVICLRERTVYSFSEINESTDKLAKAFISSDKAAPKDIDLNKLQIKLKETANTAMYNAGVMMPYTFDLAVKLVVNETKTPFITSDNPVVFYNQFLEDKHKVGSNTGIATKGLEIILPLSPRHTIIFFDKDVYKIGGKNKITIDTIASSDILAFNKLQYINANHNLYFNGEIQEYQIRDLVGRNTHNRRKEKSRVDQYLVEMNDDKEHDLLHHYSCDIKCKFKVSFIHILKKARKYKLKDNCLIAPVRDEEFCRLHKAFMKQVEKGHYEVNEFSLYRKKVGQ